jgi:hypothetical protein
MDYAYDREILLSGPVGVLSGPVGDHMRLARAASLHQRLVPG